jgi:plasmid stability protein
MTAVATLHVRNVPDPLYEALRDEADRDGRSIGAEAILLLERALFQQRDVRGGIRAAAARRSPFMRRFAETGKDVARRAQEHARELGAREVTPAHVLLAMLDDDVLRRSLEAAGITEDAVRAKLPRGRARTTSAPFSAETKKLLETALRASLASGQREVGPEHVAFALGGSPAVAQLGIPREWIARAVAGGAGAQVEEYRALRLTGSADRWTEQLNELASEGWELFSVTPAGAEVRAILRRG